VRARRRAAGLGTALLLLAGCGGTSGSPAPVPPSAPPSAPAPTAPSAAVGTPVVTGPSPSSGSVAQVPGGAAVRRDPSLLGLLPASVAGVPVTEEPQSFAEAASDPAFAASVDRAVFLVAVSGGDLASGVIAHLRAGVYSDAMFADWRASYDDGACAQAGGVVAHAERDAGGRALEVTTCGGGLRVYHAYLPRQGVIVSLFSTGPADLGLQVMESLRA